MNRREALASMASAGVAVAVPTAAIATNRPSRTAWTSALARFQHLHAQHEAACDALNPLETRYFAERPQRPLGVEFRVGDTMEAFNARARADRENFNRLDEECRKRTGIDAAEARQAAACDAANDALDKLLDVAAPGLSEVLQKIELATRHGRTIDEMGTVQADLRRMIGMEKAQ